MRTRNYSGWIPWEYINPPLKLGVEYRTTERFLGKPVYVKVVDCAPLTDGKNVPHGITDADIIEASTPELGTTWRLEDDFARPHETPEQRKLERGE